MRMPGLREPHPQDLGNPLRPYGMAAMLARIKRQIGSGACRRGRPSGASAPTRPPAAPVGPVTAMGREGVSGLCSVPWRNGGGVMTQVTEHLEAHGVPFEPIAHQQAYTSIDEARALGIDASEVLKTVAMRVAGGYALMVVPATCRLDMHLVQAAVGDRHVRLATEQELLRDFPDCELGALPPLGSLLGAPLYVDQEVLRHETVVFAAGSQTESVQLKTADLLRHEQVTAVALIKHADENDKEWLR